MLQIFFKSIEIFLADIYCVQAAGGGEDKWPWQGRGAATRSGTLHHGDSVTTTWPPDSAPGPATQGDLLLRISITPHRTATSPSRDLDVSYINLIDCYNCHVNQI